MFMAKISIEQAQKLFKVDFSLEIKERYKKAKGEYRKLAKEYHPDSGGSTTDFQIIQEAWDLFENEINREQPKKSNQVYKPHFDYDRNVNILFREVCQYIDQRVGKSLSLTQMAKDLEMSGNEYYQVQTWLSSFQYMRYLIGNKVRYMPPGLTLPSLEEALDHVRNGNYGSINSSYGEPSLETYKALAKSIRPKTIKNNHHFDFDLEDWEKE